MKVSSWGNLEKVNAQFCEANESFHDLEKSYLPIGNLRSYGDQALSEESILILCRAQKKILDFDIDKGLIKVESGILLGDLQRYVRQYGWMLPVLPGTQFVTVGGSIANDIHGKNHHVRGSFGEWINEMTLLRSDRGIEGISKTLHGELFFATIGGCGLTGVILNATIKLVRDAGEKILEERFRFRGVKEFVELSVESLDWDSSVGWLNLFGNNEGIFSRGRRFFSEAKSHEKLYVTFPPWKGPSLLNNFSNRLLSAAYIKAMIGQSKSIVSEAKHYFPLDGVRNWNRAYGKSGFYQYQLVLPWDTAIEASSEILHCIKRHKQSSFLTVIKAFGDKSSGGHLSFPMPGITLAIDFQNLGARTESMFKDFDSIVEKAGGRLYLAKDSRMPKELFWNTYTNISKFIPFRDPAISSRLSERLLDK